MKKMVGLGQVFGGGLRFGASAPSKAGKSDKSVTMRNGSKN
ncbi:MAG TPA: hypothetical protein VK462_04355 [Nitrososphaeraceae archaeon]|nr:hypothetical protein [Nitrososphaeraceae archaeon]